MVSVWSRFDKTTTFFQNMSALGHILNGTEYYDAWSDEARDVFYGFSRTAHFSIGVESLWLDATEPEAFPNVDHRVSKDADGVGSGNLLMNSCVFTTSLPPSTLLSSPDPFPLPTPSIF